MESVCFLQYTWSVTVHYWSQQKRKNNMKKKIEKSHMFSWHAFFFPRFVDHIPASHSLHSFPQSCVHSASSLPLTACIHNTSVHSCIIHQLAPCLSPTVGIPFIASHLSSFTFVFSPYTSPSSDDPMFSVKDKLYAKEDELSQSGKPTCQSLPCVFISDIQFFVGHAADEFSARCVATVTRRVL